jgi:starvation-inducible DNA-binding protein
MKTQTADLKQIGTGLKAETRKQIVTNLNTLLADEHVLYTKTRNFHWNVTGIHFSTLHALFEEQYEAIKLMADEIAERTRKLGGFAIGSMRAFSQYMRLEDAPDTQITAEAMLIDLVEDHEQIIRNLRDDIDRAAELGDEGSADLLTGILRQHESMAWMLRSMLQS